MNREECVVGLFRFMLTLCAFYANLKIVREMQRYVKIVDIDI